MQLRLAALLSLAALAGCRCNAPLSSECTDGAVRTCFTADGESGVQGCANGVFLDCTADIIDGGAPQTDAGQPVVDAGQPIVDAGSPIVDAGSPIVDAGSPIVDAGSPTVDAGPPLVDAGAPQSVHVNIPSGSGASSSARFKARVRVGGAPGAPSPVLP